MPEVVLHDGLVADGVALAVVIDPEGSPGERAVTRIGEFCYVDEEDEVAYILRTDGWAETHLENGVVTVDIMVYEAMLRHFDDVDLTLFEERSRHDPDAVRVLRVTGTTTHDTLPGETLVYLAPLDRLEEDDWPLVFAPPPEA